MENIATSRSSTGISTDAAGRAGVINLPDVGLQ
jgi:hypothetical protein